MVHYTITVANTGQTPYTGATFTDSLSSVLGDATYDGNAAATAGTVTFASPTLTWTGNLAVGADGDDHLLGHGEQSGYRRPDHGQYRCLDDAGQQLPGRRHRRPVHGHRS